MAKLTKRAILLLITFIIGTTLVAYAFLFQPPQPPSATKHSYDFIFFDAISIKVEKPVTDLTVSIVGKNYNITLDKPNKKDPILNEEVVFSFSNLTRGETYTLKVFSKEHVLLYNKTFTVFEDKSERIELKSQPLTISVFVNDLPSPIPLNITIKNKEGNININKTSQAGSINISEIPLGEYVIIVKHKKFTINETKININGTLPSFTIRTNLYNATIYIFDQNEKEIRNVFLNLIYNNEVLDLISSSTNKFELKYLPPLKYDLVFQLYGVNLTVEPAPILDLTTEIKPSYNYTAYLGNLTLKVKYDDGKEARGLKVSIHDLYNTFTGAQGNVTLLNIPAKSKFELKIYRDILVAKVPVELLPSNNTLEITINKISLQLNITYYYTFGGQLKGYTVFHDQFNKTNILKLEDFKNITLEIYPGNYYISSYIINPLNESINVYSKFIALNKTLTMINITLPVGFRLNIDTGDPSANVYLYYVNLKGNETLIDKKIGEKVSFYNLYLGSYKVLVEAENYKTSKIIMLNFTSEPELNISIKVAQANNINKYVFDNLILALIILTLAIIFFNFSYKTYKKKKELFKTKK
jgi:hypothetical protein